MTYENALEWAIEHVDPLEFDSWEDYLDAVDMEFRNPFSDFMPYTYIQELEQFYYDAHREDEQNHEFTEEEPQDPVSIGFIGLFGEV